jgi:hypothetical protein
MAHELQSLTFDTFPQFLVARLTEATHLPGRYRLRITMIPTEKDIGSSLWQMNKDRPQSAALVTFYEDRGYMLVKVLELECKPADREDIYEAVREEYQRLAVSGRKTLFFLYSFPKLGPKGLT